MKLVFNLVKENIPLAIAEVLALAETNEYEIIDNLLILDTDFKDFRRLACTRDIYELLFIAYKHNLEEKMQDFDWQKIYKKNFCLRIKNSDLEAKDFAKYIWNKINSPKVNLEHPITEIHIIKQKSKFICGKLIKHLEADFESRKAHRRPEPHPTSMHPRLSRAIVNLTGIKRGEILLDPFCGSGGILIEAGLLGIKTIGYDIDKIVLKKAQMNLKRYRVKDFTLEVKDALTVSRQYDYIVADVPYGLNTSPKNLNALYENFLKLLELILRKRAVLVFPHFVNYRKLINSTNLKLKQEFSQYIHKSLTKKIIVMEK